MLQVFVVCAHPTNVPIQSPVTNFAIILPNGRTTLAFHSIFVLTVRTRKRFPTFSSVTTNFVGNDVVVLCHVLRAIFLAHFRVVPQVLVVFADIAMLAVLPGLELTGQAI